MVRRLRQLGGVTIGREHNAFRDESEWEVQQGVNEAFMKL